MLAFSFHIGIFLFFYRKYYLYKFEWEPYKTVLSVLMHNFIVFLYWIGDIELIYFKPVWYKWLWFLILTCYVFIFLNVANIYHRCSFGKEATHDSSMLPFWTLFRVFETSLKKKLKNYNKSILKKEWYNYQINYTKKYKIKFLYFIKIMSIILIIFRIIWIISIILIFYFSIHYPFFLFLKYIEFHHLYFFIFFFKIFFFFNFITSLFLNYTGNEWIFFFYSYEYRESFTDDFKLRIGSDFIIKVSNLEDELFLLHPLYRCIEFFGDQSLNYKKRDWVILYNDKGRPRFRLAYNWKKYNMKRLDCYTNTYYFKLWLKWKKLLTYIVYPWPILEFWWDGHYKREFRFGDLMVGAKSYENRIDYEKNLKRYKFK